MFNIVGRDFKHTDNIWLVDFQNLERLCSIFALSL
jgi:hypothetical protein